MIIYLFCHGIQDKFLLFFYRCKTSQTYIPFGRTPETLKMPFATDPRTQR
jgi:hypothetical protein